MIIPVRCFTCGKAIGSAYEQFQKRTAEGENAEKVLDDLGITRYCCRRMMIANIELDETLKYKV